jgi:DnaJ-class molecular chaperone
MESSGFSPSKTRRKAAAGLLLRNDCMKTTLPRETKCEACDGTGYPKVKQPDQPGRRIFPAPCKKCGGKGRIMKATAE